MIETMIMTIVALLMALVLVVTGGLLGHKMWFTRLGNVAWLGLAASFGLLSMESMHGVASLLATASLASSCMLTTVEREAWGGVRLGGVIAIVLGLCGVILAANSYYDPVVPDRNLVLFAGQWGALAACVVAALMAASHDERGESWSAGVMIALLAGGALWMGNMRSDLPGWGYAVELTSGNHPVRWVLPAVTPGASSFSFEVTQRVSNVEWALVWSALSGLAGAVLSLMGNRKGAKFCNVSAVAAGAVSLGLVLWAGFHATLPDIAAYTAYAYEVGVEKGIPEQVLAMGGFDYGETIYVLWLDVLGDVGLLAGVVLFGLFGAYRQHTQSEPEHGTSDAPMARLFCARAAGLLWMGWILGLFINWRLHAIYGVGSATEWTLLGAAIVASGASVLTLMNESPRLQRVGYLCVMLAIVLVVVLSLVFEVPPGVVMS